MRLLARGELMMMMITKGTLDSTLENESGYIWVYSRQVSKSLIAEMSLKIVTCLYGELVVVFQPRFFYCM